MPVTKPSVYINWTSDADPSKIVAPGAALALQGYIPNQPVAAQNLNWLLYTLDQWVQWLDQQTTFKASVPSTQKACLGVRLIDGGTWSWTLGTSTLAWSSTMTFAYAGVPDSYNQVAAGSVTLADGQVAYVTTNAPVFMTANIANGSANLLNVAYPADIAVGMLVSGANIPAGTTILSITGNTVGMSATATGSATGQTLAFCTVASFGVATAASSALMAGANTIVFARRSGSIVYVGAPGAEMVLRSAEKRPLLQRGFDNVVTLTSFGAVTAGQVVQILTSGGNAGKVIPADLSTGGGIASLPIVGIAVTSGTNASVDVVTSGVITLFSSLTPGLAIYADPAVAGGVTQTAPTAIGSYVAPIGMALTSTSAAVITQTLVPAIVLPPARAIIGPFVWSYASIPASPTATTVNYQLGGFVYNNSGAVVGTTLGGAVSYDHGFVAPWAGDVVGVSAIGGANLGAAKTVSCYAYTGAIASSQVAPVTLSAASQSGKSTLAVGGGGGFSAGGIIRAGVNIPSGTTYTAPGMDFVVYVVVQFSV